MEEQQETPKDLAPMKAQVYKDPRPKEYFDRFHERARTRDPDWVYTAVMWGGTWGDADISRWAAKVDDAWLNADLVWFSGAAGREMHAPKRLLVAHFFNHQTHHRGQAHALLSAAGQQTGDTDLFLIIPEMIA